MSVVRSWSVVLITALAGSIAAVAPARWLVMHKPINIPRLLEAVGWLSGRRSERPGGG